MYCIYLFDCVGSWLSDVESSLYLVESVLVVHKLSGCVPRAPECMGFSAWALHYTLSLTVVV